MGNQQPKLLTGLPVVVIVGGGYGGMAVARALDAAGQVNVIVIERKDYFLHQLGTLRAAVNPGFEQRIMVPYTHALKNGSVIHAQVTRIESQAIHLHGYDTPIQFDYAVVATGSTYAFPGKLEEFSHRGARHKYETVQSHMKQATNIVIIGGGAVGIEFAGEIATDLPDKQVTLIHSQSQLMDDSFRSEFRDELRNQLEHLKVNVVLGQRVHVTHQHDQKQDPTGTSYITGAHTWVTDHGATIHADLTLIATGTKTNTHTWKNTLPFAQDGRIQVNSFLQVEGRPHIYAVGDAASIGRKMAWFAGLHGTHVANNILASVAKKEQKPYAGDPPAAAFVTIGRNGGAAQLPVMGGLMAPSFVVKMIKSKTLFVDRYWRELHANVSSPDWNRTHDEIHIQNVSAVLGLHDKKDSQQVINMLTQGAPVDNTLEIS